MINIWNTRIVAFRNNFHNVVDGISIRRPTSGLPGILFSKVHSGDGISLTASIHRTGLVACSSVSANAENILHVQHFWWLHDVVSFPVHPPSSHMIQCPLIYWYLDEYWCYGWWYWMMLMSSFASHWNSRFCLILAFRFTIHNSEFCLILASFPEYFIIFVYWFTQMDYR